ncbi:hypothetical protein ACFQV8_16125 [Pseudonocardia benzenivorans]
MIFENGVLLAESPRFPRGPRQAVADVDLDLLRAERLRMGTFDDNRRHHAARLDSFRRIEFRLEPPGHDIGLRREVERFPFVPADPARLAQDCYEAYNIQVSGLEQRLRAIGQPKVVIGVSGGLDSTHALIVAARAMDREDRPRSDILAFTLPGFATGERTKNNATRLAEALGVTFETIDITETARLMLRNLAHPFSSGEPVYDVTFENVQAGLRTDYLFRAANQRNGIVLGTGDLSELALGWSTYGVGDQMSHYNVNGGVPKTLIQHLIRWVVSSKQFDDEVGAVLTDVLDTEITPSSSRSTTSVRCRAARRPSGRTRCRTSPSSTCCAGGCARRRSRSWPGTRGTTSRPATGPPASPRRTGSRSPCPTSGAGSRSSPSATSGSRSSSGRRCPTGPRCPRAGRCRRGGTGARRRTCRRGSGSTRSAARYRRPEPGAGAACPPIDGHAGPPVRPPVGRRCGRVFGGSLDRSRETPRRRIRGGAAAMTAPNPAPSPRTESCRPPPAAPGHSSPRPPPRWPRSPSRPASSSASPRGARDAAGGGRCSDREPSRRTGRTPRGARRLRDVVGRDHTVRQELGRLSVAGTSTPEAHAGTASATVDGSPVCPPRTHRTLPGPTRPPERNLTVRRGADPSAGVAREKPGRNLTVRGDANPSAGVARGGSGATSPSSRGGEEQ